MSYQPPDPNPQAWQWKPSNNDTENSNVPDHFTYCPPMRPLVNGDKHLLDRYFELDSRVDKYLQSLAPPYFKTGLLTMNTIGKECLVPPSQRNPLVIVLMLATCDIPRINQNIYETIVGFIREFFDEPIPPFRFYIEDRVSL